MCMYLSVVVYVCVFWWCFCRFCPPCFVVHQRHCVCRQPQHQDKQQTSAQAFNIELGIYTWQKASNQLDKIINARSEVGGFLLFFFRSSLFYFARLHLVRLMTSCLPTPFSAAR
ncbi:hypothetical protein LX32DRAFT_126413 [Colletotrichum zoysiae]|uniref:Secreted protein n=1 Tax=Colletotrichum zoysiae TaxID=1216348 RepID=A0AAD9H7T8_9PEZI|nr:hypothetical protein LX32DRAFT_126413 [Colletotrichum zoysiae]